MKIATVDDKSRIRIPELKPGQKFAFENKGNGVLVLTEVAPKEPPIVNPIRRKDGSYKWPVKLTRADIVAAIRADRDSR